MTEGNGNMSGEGGNTFHKKDDPQNVRITNLIREHVFSGTVGREMMQKSYQLQLQYYKDSLAHLSNPDYIYGRNQEVLRDLSQATNSRIVKGEEYLDQLPKGSPVLALLNHFSIYKLTGIEQSKLGINTNEIDDVPPPPIHFSAIYPIAEKIGNDLFDAHLELPEPLLAIQKAGGFIGVTPKKEGQFETTLERTREHVQKHPNSLTVIFPEGATSGRTNNGGPFDMLPFHKGGFLIAAKLGIPILPTAQYFNPNSGFEIAVFTPILPNPDLDGEAATKLAEKTQLEMQAWLDERKSA